MESPLKPWYFEDYEVGQVFETPGRTITDADITDLIEVPQLDDGELFIIGRIRSQKALEVALAAEQQAHSYYSRLSERTEEPHLRALYTEFAQLERDHEEFIEQKLKQAQFAPEGD